MVFGTLNRHDPIGLIGLGAPADEYMPEVEAILPRIRDAKSEDQVHRILYEEFSHLFSPDVAGDETLYRGASEELWAYLKALGPSPIRRADEFLRGFVKDLDSIALRPPDENPAWIRGANAALNCDNDFGVDDWKSLVTEDIRNIRWMIGSALHVFFESGHRPVSELKSALIDLRNRNPDFSNRLQRFIDGDDPQLAFASEVALSVLNGEGKFL